MSMVTLDHAVSLGVDRPAAKPGWARRLWRSMVISRAEQIFRSLDDRSLAQLGISRSEIPEAARRLHDGY